MANNQRATQQILIVLIKIYQYLISPWFGHCCRFYPSCSVYCIEAVNQRGVAFGLILTIKRILRCHPWHPGGVDFVPAATPTPLLSKQHASAHNPSRRISEDLTTDAIQLLTPLVRLGVKSTISHQRDK